MYEYAFLKVKYKVNTDEKVLNSTKNDDSIGHTKNFI